MTLLIIAAVAQALLTIWIAWELMTAKARLNGVLAGKTGRSLEPVIKGYMQRIDEVAAGLKTLDQAYDHIRSMAEMSSQKVSIVRFNPFGDTGGDQSFSLAVLDAHHSGYVLTSIHGRGGTRVYVKPVDIGESKYPLSEEEKKALRQAEKRSVSASK